MIDEELETDELDTAADSEIDADDLEIGDVDDIEEDDVDDIADDSVDDGSDAVVTPSSRTKSKAAVSSEDLPSIEAKQKERDALAKAMEEFLARGGKVQEVENNIDV